jgi:hypothetical protein
MYPNKTRVLQAQKEGQRLVSLQLMNCWIGFKHESEALILFHITNQVFNSRTCEYVNPFIIKATIFKLKVGNITQKSADLGCRNSPDEHRKPTTPCHQRPNIWISLKKQKAPNGTHATVHIERVWLFIEQIKKEIIVLIF